MISINLDKAKGIAHDARRESRAKEFAPLDEVIMKQIPGNDPAEAEAERQLVRDKYAAIQSNIDAAEDIVTLKTIMSDLA